MLQILCHNTSTLQRIQGEGIDAFSKKGGSLCGQWGDIRSRVRVAGNEVR